jgi:hypothetical protein
MTAVTASQPVAQLEPTVDRAVQVVDDITDLANRAGQDAHEAVGCTTTRGGPWPLRTWSMASGTSSRPMVLPILGDGSSLPSATASSVPYQSCGCGPRAAGRYQDPSFADVVGRDIAALVAGYSAR